MLDWPSSIPHVHQLEVVGKTLSPRFRDPSSQHTVGKGCFPKRKWDTVRKRVWVRSGFQIQMSSSSWTSKTKVCILSFPIPAWYRQRFLISGNFVLLLPETFSNVWDIFGCWEEVWLASSGQQPEMLLPILSCTQQPCRGKDDPAHSVSGAKLEKLWYEQTENGDNAQCV